MFVPFMAIVAGLALLVWSADKFVDGSSAAAGHFGMPPLLIGMIIVGFGTSMPEMTVSALSALHGSPNIALGNAYGSNIVNIALIIGLTAAISPIAVHSTILRRELPILTFVTVAAGLQILDGEISRFDSFVLLAVFASIVGWSVFEGMSKKKDSLKKEFEKEAKSFKMPIKIAFFWVIAGLSLLVLSSRMLVWGSVEIATALGVSDLIIGLTVVAVGTSLPELASSMVAARKGEHDIALGNIIGSNLFNTLAVVGIAGAIKPIPVSPDVVSRDFPFMLALTLSLFFFCYGMKKPNMIGRISGAVLLTSFAGYTAYLVFPLL